MFKLNAIFVLFSKKTNLLFALAASFFVLYSCSSDDNVFIIPSDNDEFIYQVHFIDVGQGDAIYVVTPGKNVLVDGGWRNGGIREYLQSLDVERIDIVIGTHPHADHIGGLIDVFHAFEVGEVIDPGVSHTTLTFNQYLSAIDYHSIPFVVGRKGMEWQLSEDAHMVLLHPVNPSSDHLNNASVVARITLGEVTLLLTGDAELAAEDQMLSDPELLNVNVLKVGHHGSWTSSNEAFLAAVLPEVSVIQCGADNPYGHPHNVALQRLHAVGTEIYRTDIHGTVIMESDGVEYKISTEKE
ncbi:MAG: ComEC/Rec2 family competence protein [Bacteroidales bacterium]|nr:ComEC/Rec2 family competence protein [Bacteroidales bacterium]